MTGRKQGPAPKRAGTADDRRVPAPSDERAVSIAITHALTFGITAVLISALLLSSGQYLSAQERQVSQNQFTDIGSDVVSHVNSFDRLNETGRDVSGSVEPDYPDRVVGHSYTISIAEDDDGVFPGVAHVIQIESQALERPLQYPLRTESTLDVGASMAGDRAVVCLRNDEITLGGECS